MYYVYMLRCTDSSIYTGSARDIQKRLSEHFGKSDKKAKYTKSHPPLRLEALWKCESKSDALKLEYRIKELTKTQKERLINENFAPDSICVKLIGLEFERIDPNTIVF